MDTKRRFNSYFFIACLTLGIGYLIYFIGRTGPSIYAIPVTLEHWVNALPLLSDISGQLPSFFHTYAFILLTFIALDASSRFSLFLSISLWVYLCSCHPVGPIPLRHRLMHSVVADVATVRRVARCNLYSEHSPGGKF